VTFRIGVLALVSVLILGGLFFVLPPTRARCWAAGTLLRPADTRERHAVPAKVSVHKGDRVTLSVTADRPAGVHVHGYDFEEVEPGEATVHSFEAATTGRFSVEDQGTGAELGVLVVEPR
jgi:hypothetical protein